MKKRPIFDKLGWMIRCIVAYFRERVAFGTYQDDYKNNFPAAEIVPYTTIARTCCRKYQVTQLLGTYRCRTDYSHCVIVVPNEVEMKYKVVD